MNNHISVYELRFCKPLDVVRLFAEEDIVPLKAYSLENCPGLDDTKWLSTNFHTPKDYIVWVKSKENIVLKAFWVSIYRNFYVCHHTNYLLLKDITHWMPIERAPEPHNYDI